MYDYALALNSPNATEADVLAYLPIRIEEILRIDGHAMSIEEFWKPSDLITFRQAETWWPHDAPMMLGKPTLLELCNTIGTSKVIPLWTFAYMLQTRGERVVKWLEANDRNIQNPNETKVERKARKGREAVARHRARKANTVNPDEQAALNNWHALREVYLATCRTRAAAIKEHDALVQDALAKYNAAKPT